MKKTEKTKLTVSKIIEAAMNEFGQNGYAGGTINNICKTGINKGLIYHNFSGHLILNDKGEATVNFGKHKGKTARQVFESDPSYYDWVQKGSFTLDTKQQFEKLYEQFRREQLAAKFNTKR